MKRQHQLLAAFAMEGRQIFQEEVLHEQLAMIKAEQLWERALQLASRRLEEEEQQQQQLAADANSFH